jgi:hypothetical protein
MDRPFAQWTGRQSSSMVGATLEAWQQDCWVLSEQDLGAGQRRVRVVEPGTAPPLHSPCPPPAGHEVTAADEDELSLLAVLVRLGGAARAPRPRLPVAADSAQALLPVVQALVSGTTDGFSLWWLREAQRVLRAAEAKQRAGSTVVPIRAASPSPDPIFHHLGETRRSIARAVVEGLLRPAREGLEVMCGPVTNAVFELMDPSHAQRRAQPAEGAPAANLSWYEASLFAEWVGMRLPSSAERAELAELSGGVPGARGLSGGLYEWCDDEAPSLTAGLDLPLPDRFGVHEEPRRFIAACRADRGELVIAHPAERQPVIGLRLVRGAMTQRVSNTLRAVS